ncbi:MAG TPA: glycosyltransferase [Thermoanaerobaculia bacterium]|jgi:glycosyltransferase involved in cell wall biosynthesis
MSSRPERVGRIPETPATHRITTTVITKQENAAPARTAEPAAEPRVRNAIAVLMLRFPHLADTFLLREINELERQGQPVVVVPALHGDVSVIHEEAKPWISRALFTPLASWEILRSNIKVFFKQPRNYLRVLSTLILGTFVRPSTLLRTIALFPKSVHLATVLPERGVHHLHAHFATHATTMAYIISSLTGLTYSFTVHGPDVFVHRLLLREKIRRAKFVRSVSVFNKAFLSGLYPEETYGKIDVVRTGVNPDVYEEAASEHAAKPNPRPLIVSIADLTPSRGFPYLVDACARLVKAGMDVECRIVGEGPLRAVTEQWIAEHGISDNVHLIGARPQHEVAALMGQSDVFVLPSIVATDGQMDGIPVSLMEAMAAAKPVIASSISGIPELVHHEVSGLLVDAAHPERVAQAITRLVRDPALSERMGRAGQQKVRKYFDVRRNISDFLRLLDKHEQGDTGAADWIASINWSRLNATAVGVRRVHDRTDTSVAEVTISDGVAKRDVIVRRPHADLDDESSPLERARAEFEVISTLAQTLGAAEGERTSSGTRYAVPRLLMYDEPNATLVFERADGRSLAGILRTERTNRRTLESVRKAGTWLRLMQAHTTAQGDGRYVLTAVVYLALRDLDLACAAERSLAALHSEIADRIHELEARVAENPVRVVGQHGDFRADNIYIGDSRVDVTSFSRFREGLPSEDIAQFLLDLEIACDLPFRHVRAIQLREAFLAGYGMSFAELDPDELQLLTLAKALHMLAHGGFESKETRAALRKIIRRSLAE